MSNKIGLIGIGRWGKKIASVLSSYENFGGYVVSRNIENNNWMSKSFKKLQQESLDFMLSTTSPYESVIIATPMETHPDLVRRALNVNKHVLIEKPMTCKFSTAKELHLLAKERGLILFTGYEFSLDSKFENIDFNNINSYSSTWNKWGSFENHIITNLAVHDIAIACMVLGSVESVTEVNLSNEDNVLLLKMKHARGNSHIMIDRLKNESTRKISLMNSRSGENMIFQPSDLLLDHEIEKFILAVTSHEKNFSSEATDISVAQTLEMIAEKYPELKPIFTF